VNDADPVQKGSWNNFPGCPGNLELTPPVFKPDLNFSATEPLPAVTLRDFMQRANVWALT
jgi:hypothetical protein